MALSGVHIVFGYDVDSSLYKSGARLPYQAQSSQTMPSAGTSTISAPSGASGQKVLLSIAASLAIFYVIGPKPDINNDPRRYFDPTSSPRQDIFVDPGDKFAWTAA